MRSSLAFGTLYAEAQRRYLESVSPYARRLFHQMGVPEVDEIEGLPPAVALQQQRGAPSTRSSVGSVTTLFNLLRMLYSRAGDYPRSTPHLESAAGEISMVAGEERASVLSTVQRHTEPFFGGRPYNPLPIWLTMALERWLQMAFGRG